MLAGCEQNDETVSLYQNADDCASATGKAAECTTAYNNALKEAERTAPKYASREDCVAEFGEGQCQQAPAQAGMAPENRAQAQSSGSLDAADGGLYDGPFDERRCGLPAAAAV